MKKSGFSERRGAGSTPFGGESCSEKGKMDEQKKGGGGVAMTLVGGGMSGLTLPIKKSRFQ